MRFRFFNSFSSIVLVLLGAGITTFAQVDTSEIPSLSPSPSLSATPKTDVAGTLVEDPNSLLHFKKKDGADVDTIRMIDAQNKITETGNHNTIALQGSILTGQAKAQEMVNALKGEELQKAMAQVTPRGKQMLQENPELKNPVMIIGGAFALWAGNTLRIIKEENFKINTYVQAKNRIGEFQMESPLFNGKLQFNDTDGVQVNMNRSISSIDSKANFSYSEKQQTVGGSLSHMLMPHVNLSVGTTQNNATNQIDQQAKIEYNLSF